MIAYEYHVLPYLLSLPTPKTREEEKEFRRGRCPFILSNDIVNIIHEACGAETSSIVFNVYLPSKNSSYEITCPHYSANNPLRACKAAYKKRLHNEGKDKKYIEKVISMFFQEMELPENPSEIMLIELAKEQSINKWRRGKNTTNPCKGYLLK